MYEKIEKRAKDGELKAKPNEYKIEAEIGRVELTTYQIEKNNKVVYDTGRDMLPKKAKSEYYMSICFEELALEIPTKESYREAGNLINRVRRQKDGHQLQYRTLANMVERAGRAIQDYVESKSDEIFEEHDIKIGSDGVVRVPDDKIEVCKAEYIDEAVVAEKIEKYNNGKDKELQIETPELRDYFENLKSSIVNISADDVLARKQKENGREKYAPPTEKRSWIKNSVIHIEKEGIGRYIFNSGKLLIAFQMLVAFLFANSLQNTALFMFFVDGAPDLKIAIEKYFSWTRYKIVLDWHHLIKKCEQRLSMGIKGSNNRNMVLDKVNSYLWVGKVDLAIQHLRNLDKSIIKNEKEIESLIDYFTRNGSYIPCYALRNLLGLRNSSNPVEKANDLLVSNRQKDNGSSWSKDGSVSLATVTALKVNDEMDNWIKKRELRFSLKKDAA